MRVLTSGKERSSCRPRPGSKFSFESLSVDSILLFGEWMEWKNKKAINPLRKAMESRETLSLPWNSWSCELEGKTSESETEKREKDFNWKSTTAYGEVMSWLFVVSTSNDGPYYLRLTMTFWTSAAGRSAYWPRILRALLGKLIFPSKVFTCGGGMRAECVYIYIRYKTSLHAKPKLGISVSGGLHPLFLPSSSPSRLVAVPESESVAKHIFSLTYPIMCKQWLEVWGS